MLLSSALTLYLKFMLTVFWTVFFGSFAVALWVVDREGTMAVSPSVKWGFSAFFVLGVIVIYRTIFRLKRVDVADGGLVITNYFKTYHFPVPLIQTMQILPLLLSYKIVVLRFVKPTAFGKKVFFLTNVQRLNSFEENHRDWMRSWEVPPS